MEEISFGIGSIVNHPEFGKGVIVQMTSDAYEVTFIDHGLKKILKSFEGLEVLYEVEEETDLVSYEKVEKSFYKIIRNITDIQETVPLADKWTGGRIILEPGSENYKGKDMPIDVFFHKIVMLRDRIRVMEQRINSSKLSDTEKVNLQQYITRIYGTLTSFNVLFAEKDHHFIGEKGKA
jgi:hypothetical protein